MSGSYQALYRKWRPLTFADVVGQRHVSDTLRAGIAAGRIAHAYLFCGTRGTGKTSTAKIFSRAVNCENPQDGEPCNQCPTCRGILDGSILDVYEMDAASNRSVDNIRDIRDEIIYTPVGCTYKVYIIDEVHMLTEQAFNALLKTLEEPPAHALFILATTDPQKIPATVQSRCQRFDFRRIGVEDIAGRLTEICTAEGIPATPDALELVAELGDGSMRDALSLLDQCAAFGLDQLTADRVTEIVGMADPRILTEIAAAAAAEDTQRALAAAETLLRRGKEVQNFLEDLSGYFWKLLLCKATDNPAPLIEQTAETVDKLLKQAKAFSTEQLIYIVKTLSDALTQAKTTANPRIAAEMAVIRICNPAYSDGPEALLARIERLERRLANVGGGADSPAYTPKPPAPAEDAPPWNAPAAASDSPAAPATSAPPPTAEPDSGGGDTALWECWADALDAVKRESKKLYTFLYHSKAYYADGWVELELNTQTAYDRISKPEGLDYLEKLFSRVCGHAVRVKAMRAGERKAPAQEAPEAPQDTGSSIMDLAEKKSVLGDKLQIIENQE